MRKSLLLTLCLVIAGIAQLRAETFTDNYRVLTEKSIFSRTPLRRTTSRQSYSTPTEPRPAQWMVLRGISRQNEGSGYVALIENISTGATTRASIGDSVAQGQVTRLALDAIEFTSNGHAVRVPVGSRLDSTGGDYLAMGSSSGTTLPTTNSTASSGSTTSTPSTGGGGDDIVERLRQRRLKELNKGN